MVQRWSAEVNGAELTFGLPTCTTARRMQETTSARVIAAQLQFSQSASDTAAA